MLDCMNNNEGICQRHFCTPKTNRENCTSLEFLNIVYLSSDIGLFLQFDTDPETGRPRGCSGLNNRAWLENQVQVSGEPQNNPARLKNGIPDTSVPHGCPMNAMMDEDGNKMHEIVELFASSNQLWIDEFIVVFQKMQENGYKQNGNLFCNWKFDVRQKSNPIRRRC